MVHDSVVRIGLVLPDVLGTYGDSGNATVLLKRLEWRGIRGEVVQLGVGDPVPNSLDIYLLGGGEDRAQTLAVSHLTEHPGMQQAAANGAVVMAVCAGLQILGEDFTGSDGVTHGGLGLLDVRTTPGSSTRAVGELLTLPDKELFADPMTGFENHQGHTQLGASARPLSRVVYGTGNGEGHDGAYQGHVLGTYMHGPVLARNPAFADLMLTWAVGSPLAPIDVPAISQLRNERRRAVQQMANRRKRLLRF
ncbi:glutamine amidotransferase [Kutzneria albida DSM 43870]|uniref:Lipid II isoglutaminyl synthase (glutamine-hydrolyzing) subunit GatD n=1 Tax=Kutzneria albida DSM 43870 TaxID=1449976 RepID=W5W6S8_9PSEU|nr:glutamine amidotransferase [Kutzneria albida DSM 43870]